MRPIVKTCSCGRAYTALTWDMLQRPDKEDRILSEDETGKYVTHLRNCLCGSTIATEERLGLEVMP